MKKNIIYSLMGLAMTAMTTGCLEETFPTGGATADQLQTGDKDPLVSAITSFMNHGDTSYGDFSYIGYPGMLIWRDVMTDNMCVLNNDYNYFSYYASLYTLGDMLSQYDFWIYYYSIIKNANTLIGVCDSEVASDREALGNGLAYRALAYMDLMRFYEYKHTGVENLDALAGQFGSFKVTVPLITEKTTEDEGRNNPRAPFYKMYRFVNEDLSMAESCMEGVYSASDKAHMTLGAVYGLSARFWLELGTRFELYPEDLDTQLSHEDDAELADFRKLAISSKEDCYRRAAEYARKAINCGYTPVTKAEWYNTTTGFNTAGNAWILAIVMGTNDPSVTGTSFFSWVSYMCPEAKYGVAGPEYMAANMLNAATYHKMPDADWRKLTWIDPEDFTSPSNRLIFEDKYKNITTLSYDEWCNFGPYVGFKFRPGSGESVNNLVGNKVDIPVMRVEEMYFIEAEATARLSGFAAGKQLLEAFVNGYRYEGGTYTCPATDMQSFLTELIDQKAIEFWGEGIVVFDYKRLERPVKRGYPGTNHLPSFRYNSYEGYVAPWLNHFIPSAETDMNTACVLNPDPSTPFPVWQE